MADPRDPFREARDAGAATVGTVAGEDLVLVLRHRQLKAVARDWTTFSSDAPFRVPIPEEHAVRSVRQLPIETDPPEHTAYRRVVRGPFGRVAAARLAPRIRDVVDALLDDALAAARVEVVREFALPLQSRALALLLGRPLEEAEHWISWGTHVFRDPDAGPGGHAQELDRYLEAALDRAAAAPGDDVFGLLVTSTVDGRPLTRAEALGFANLFFAGGRDTVINLVANVIAYLGEHPASLRALHDDPSLARTATEEFLRFFSPLTHIGRVAQVSTELHGCPVPEGHRVALGFASANRDPAVFDRPDECVLDRFPNRHVAFGHGPHTCLGAPLTREVTTILLERLAARVGSISVLGYDPTWEDVGDVRRQVGFDRLDVGFAPSVPGSAGG